MGSAPIGFYYPCHPRKSVADLLVATAAILQGNKFRRGVSKEMLAASHDYEVKGNYMTSFPALVLLQAAVSDQEALSEMNDLGVLMLVGFVLAVAVAIGLTVIRLKIREKKPATPQFISIHSQEKD